MKRCGRCTQGKLETDFGFRNKALGKRHSICKTCQRAYRSEYVERIGRDAHHRAIVGWTAKARLARKNCLHDYLRDHPCIDCGQSDPGVLDFDHVRGTKIAAISAMVRDVRSMDTIWIEVAKCDVRCANCHRRRTAVTLWSKAQSLVTLGRGSGT